MEQKKKLSATKQFLLLTMILFLLPDHIIVVKVVDPHGGAHISQCLGGNGFRLLAALLQDLVNSRDILLPLLSPLTDRGKLRLQNLVFDDEAFANHRAMAALFSVILDLPPLKQALASKQFKSIYLDKLLSSQINKGRERAKKEAQKKRSEA